MEGMAGAEKGLKLFGVMIVGGVRWARDEDEAALDSKGEERDRIMNKGMLKSKSMGNLVACAATLSGDHGAGDQGYLSDGGLPQSSRRREGHERKRGVPWTEEEHRTFLAGLEKLGKGDWRGISRNFVMTRTPTQVASHAQKYFLRQNNLNKKKRRSSLFDVVITNKNLETPPNSPLRKSDETVQEIVNLCLNNPSAGSSSFSLFQPGFPAAPSRSSSSPDLLNPSQMELISPALSLTPSIAATEQPASAFLKISVPFRTPQMLTNSSTISNGDLELSIAPPQSRNNLPTLSSGTISVI
ncbi:hypothetical protein KSP40_PGU010319 [Platanthera guangdongensis]|uniref:Uncharacterized protein n=1 Tax=Platanthera guangdongensis TaxID=2320717 RepID=A0ABR2LPR9_9ASPA